MKRLFITLLILSLMLVGCGSVRITHSEFMMDTVISYDVTHSSADSLIAHCSEITAAAEDLFSAYSETSAVSEFNNSDKLIIEDIPELYDTLRIASEVYEISDGAFDITVFPLVRLWNVTHSEDDWTPPTDDEILSLMPDVGMDKLMFDSYQLTRAPYESKTEIDLGGIAKGYTLGKCAEYLTENNAIGTVSFGGNIALVGNKEDGSAWKVGIKNPFSPDTFIGTLSLDSGIVSVSGSYERYTEYDGVRYHHIIDPKTGYPAESDLASVAVWMREADAYNGAYADALSTALFVMGHDAALELYKPYSDFEAVLIKNDGTVTLTDGLTARYTSYEE
ncbi:MAG: FAD:protein FMN transferase [Clostridia bacterium]|nr:FAD:protein FMN transferase [Clostridia bacterium]